jgi:thiol-disulfide isomerase/thioredoxin
MTRSEVEQRLGPPFSFAEASTRVILNYPNGQLVLRNGTVRTYTGFSDSGGPGSAEPPPRAEGQPAAPVAGKPAPPPLKKSTGTQPPSQFQWSRLEADALKRSRQSGLPVLALFTGPDWCGPCQRLEREVLKDPAFQNWVRERYIPFKVALYRNTPQPPAEKAQYQSLLGQHEVRGVPAFRILDSDGIQVARVDLQKRQAGVNSFMEHTVAAIEDANPPPRFKYWQIAAAALGLIALAVLFLRSR